MRHKQVDQIYWQARSQPPGGRKSYLDRACAGEPSVRDEVERPLGTDAETGNPPDERTGSANEQPFEHVNYPSAVDLTGRRLSHYHVLDKVGRGGMGVVYLAHDEHLERGVAIKVLPTGALGDTRARKQFRKEALALSRLNHPNIETVYDFDTEGGIDFLVMEYLPGMTLSDKLASGPLSIEEIAGLGEQLVEGLEAAHAQGIVHCDLKPSNLLIGSGGRLKILDFGLARLLRASSETSSLRSMSDVHTGGGTVPYMSPEQLRGESIDARSDLFSCGAVLYEMATGKRAFDGNTPTMVADAILHRRPTAPAELNPGVPSDLQQIIVKALEKEPRNRYQSAHELLLALRRCRPLLAPKPEEIPRRGFPAWAIVGAAAVFLAVIWVWSIWRNYPLPEPRPSRVTRGTNWAGQPQVSPDGSHVVYTSKDSEKSGIWLADTSGQSQEWLAKDLSDASSPTWFPDASSIAFVREQGDNRAIWTMSLKNRECRLCMPDASDPAISGDGKHIAFARRSSSGHLRIFVASLDNPAQVWPLTDDKAGFWDHSSPAWSPDDKEICYASRHGLWIVPAMGGSARRLTPDYELDFDPAWSHKTPYIYFTSYRGGTLAIWRVKSSGGKPERVTMGTGPESHPSVSWNGKLLVHANGTQNPECVLIDLQSGKSTIVGTSEPDYFASLAPDASSIVYASRQGAVGSMNLWIQELDQGIPSGQPRQLTRLEGRATFPAFSPQGGWIAFYRIVREERDIWTVPVSGAAPIQITDTPGADMFPSWSPNASKLAFSSERTGEADIWIADIQDGKRRGPEHPLTTGRVNANLPSWSPDGRWIAFAGDIGGRSEVWVVPSDGGSPPKAVTTGAEARRVRWDPVSGDILTSATWGTDRISLWRISPTNGSGQLFAPEIYFGQKHDTLFGLFDISADGRFLLFAHSGGAVGQICTIEAARNGVY